MAGFDPNYYTKIRNGAVASNIKLVPDYQARLILRREDSYLRNLTGLLITPWICVILPNNHSKFHMMVGKDV